MSQTEESKAERLVMGQLLEKERKDIKIIKDLLSSCIPPHSIEKEKQGRER